MATNSIVTIKYGEKATKPIFQWDYGQTLKFDGFGDFLPDVGFEVHFANPADETSVTSIGTAEGVQIPDALLQTGLSVIVWVYLHDTATDGETEYRFTIPVARRAMPDNGEVTPEQADVIDQAIAALQSGVSRAETAADNAVASETAAAASAAAAAGSASSAYSDAERAENAAGAAEGFAQIASESEGAAQGYATAAAASAAAASQSEASAAQSASAAQVSASAAIAAAQGAQNSESSASASASSAAASATSAGQSATTAVAQATAAAASASSAGTSADSASASASSADDDRKRAEAWAAGTIDGVDVPSTDPAYHNNAKFYRDDLAETAETSEAWAVGTRGGTDVPSTDPAYDNNAKYWAEQARDSLEGLRTQVDWIDRETELTVGATSTDTEPDWELGAINASTGANSPSTTRIRFVSYITINKLVNVTIAEGAKVTLRPYDDSGNFVPYGTPWYTGAWNFWDRFGTWLEAHPTATRLRLVAAYTDDRTVTDVADLSAMISVSNPAFVSSPELKARLDALVDSTLSQSGKAADAAVTGAALYRSKNRDSNTAAALTWWLPAIDGFVDSTTPFAPSNMPMNSYTYVLGERFTDDFIPAGSSKGAKRGYWIFKFQSLYNANIKCYFVFSSTDRRFYFGQTVTAGGTLAMRVLGAELSPKIMYFGDSIARGITSSTTPNSYTTSNIPNLVAKELGVVVDNYGIGSIGWLDNGGETKGTAFQYLQRVGNADWYTDEDNYANNKFLVGEVKTWSDYNTIVLAYGANDRAAGGSATTLGSLDDIDDTMTYEEVMAMTPTTIVEAMYQCYRYIREQAPTINIIISDPIMQKGGSAPEWSYPTKYSPTKWSWYDLCDMYAAFAKRYGLGHISNYDAPINRVDPNVSLPDNVHPSQACYYQLARHFAGKISALVF